jgi:BlaI family penicillinase repressor
VVQSRLAHVSRRERQILDALYRLHKATVTEVRAAMPDPPGYSAVRAMLRILEDKGHVKHELDGPRYVFSPTLKKDSVKRSALRHVVDTFFEGSAAQVMAALFDISARKLKEDELTRLRQLIDQAEKAKE